MCVWMSPGLGAAANRLRRVHGPPGDDPDHRHRHQPGQEHRSVRHLQHREGVAQPCKKTNTFYYYKLPQLGMAWSWLFFFCCVNCDWPSSRSPVAVDLLGRPVRRRRHRGVLPPVHPPGRRHQGPRLLQEQRVISRGSRSHCWGIMAGRRWWSNGHDDRWWVLPC